MDNIFPCILGVLEGMRWAGEPLALTSDLQFRAGSSRERFFVEDLTRSNQKAGRHLDFPLLDRDTCLLECRIPEEALLRVRFSPENLARAASDALLRPLTLLRLFKAGGLGVRYVLCPLGPDRNHHAARETDLLRPVQREFARNAYGLQTDEVDQLKAWMQLPWPEDLLQRSEVRWFNRTYQEASPYDWVHQVVLAIEQILFRADGDRDNLRYKFCLKGAWLLGNDFAARREVFRDLRKLYDLRSLVLHGTKTGMFDRAELGLLERCEEYLRRMIAFTLCKLQSPDHAALDDRILAGIGPGEALPMPPAPALERPREESPPRPQQPPQDRGHDSRREYPRHGDRRDRWRRS